MTAEATLPFDSDTPSVVAAKLRERARSYRSDSAALAALAVEQQPEAGLDYRQWSSVYREIAHVLHGIAAEYDGQGAA